MTLSPSAPHMLISVPSRPVCRVPGVRPRTSAPGSSWSPPFLLPPAARGGSQRRNRSPAAPTTTWTLCSSRRSPRARSPAPTTPSRLKVRVGPLPKPRSWRELTSGRRRPEPWNRLPKPRGKPETPRRHPGSRRRAPPQTSTGRLRRGSPPRQIRHPSLRRTRLTWGP